MTSPSHPRGTRRIIYTEDPSSLAVYLYPEDIAPHDMQSFVDELARGGADALAKDVFSTGVSVYWKTDLTDYDPRPQHRRFGKLIDEGVEPLNLYIDRCHKHGMTFLAGFRMNDRHWVCPFWERNPQWHLDRGTFDYRHDGVRDWMLSMMTEIVERYDVDGLELDWMRLPPVFAERPALPEQCSVITRFVARIRRMLEKAGAAKGRTLTLGVRVPAWLDECLTFGFDVATWITDGLIDSVTPTDASYCDFHARYREDFGALTCDRPCMLYPAIHPIHDRAIQNFAQGIMTLDHYRALAHSLYAQGADGLSVYNYQYHWRGDPRTDVGYPEVLGYFRHLRDPDEIAGHRREYLYYPMYQGPILGFEKSFLLTISPGENGAEREAFRFRAYERDSGATSLTMRFVATARQPRWKGALLRPYEPLLLTVDVNGHEVAPACSMYGDEGTRYEFEVSAGWLNDGDNELGIRLLKDQPIEGDVTIKNVELEVTPE